MTTSPEKAVTIVDMSFDYGGPLVLKRVNLDIEKGDFSAIIGPNGGGKTTLARLILGLLEPRSGSITVFGRSASSARRRLGYVPQFPHLDYDFPVTVMDVVLMGRLGGGLSFGPYRRVDHERAERALSEVSARDLTGRPFRDLSIGQRQRTLIARALAADPDLLLLDEPASNLDPSVQDDFYDLLHQLNERMTVVVVSHDVSFVSKYVNRVICVNKEVVLHSASAIKGDLTSMFYGETGMHLVDHDGHSHKH